MSKLALIKAAVTSKGARSLLLLKKFSPEILVVVGIAGVITSTVMACKATIKAEDALENAKGKLDKIHIAHDTLPVEDYSGTDYKRDIAVVYAQTAVDFVIVYWKPITLGVLSVGCILAGHNILKQRNVALMAAYKAVEESYSDYRKRVVAKYGVEEDRRLKYGITTMDVTDMAYTDENGVEHEAKTTTVEVIDPNGHSEYAKFFDEYSTQWSKDPGYNMAYLKGQQNFANDMLRSRGHVFLNEVYDLIGVPHTTAGAVVGWVKGQGDDYIDFGIFDAESGKARDFVNGYERSILLDFNVDGTMYDKI